MTPLVGGDAGVGRLAWVVPAAAGSTGAVVLVSGEAGIGKTRLCDEAGRVHRGGGGQLLVGRALPEDATIPFGPVVDSLRAARRSEAALWDAVRARSGVLRTVAPELASETGGGGRGARPPGRVVGAAAAGRGWGA